MSLYDIMNKKPKQAPVVESVEAPVVAEEKAPVAPVQQGPVQAESQAVQGTETPQKKPYTWWWQTPDFVGAVESQAKAAEKRADQDRKRARRERNIAILGDLAKLGAQMYAKNGGAWKIDPFTPATEKANGRLAALKERHAAEVAAFARQRAAAKQAQIADNNARMKLEASLAEADLDRRIKAAEKAADREQKDKHALVEHLYKVQRDQVGDAQKTAELAEKKRYNDIMLGIRKSEVDSRNAYRAAVAEWRKSSPRSGKDENGNISLYLKGQDTPIITMSRQFWEDNQSGIQAIAERARFAEWLNSLDDFGKAMYSLGKIDPPKGEADWSQYPDAVKEVVELHKAWQEKNSANVSPVAPLPQDTTKSQGAPKDLSQHRRAGSPMNRKNNQGDGAY